MAHFRDVYDAEIVNNTFYMDYQEPPNHRTAVDMNFSDGGQTIGYSFINNIVFLEPQYMESYIFSLERDNNFERNPVKIEYNCFFGYDSVLRYPRIEYELPETNTLQNPGFSDIYFRDFNLTEFSPCIDAGDPDSPFDPDSTRADIGAFYYHHQVSVPIDLLIPHPSSFILSVFPNPFNSTTTLTFTLPHRETATLKVYDLSGRELATLHSGLTLPGVHRAVWDASTVATGVYVAKLQAGAYNESKTITIIK
jgi:hypothetical protein